MELPELVPISPKGKRDRIFAGEASPAKEACHKIFCSVAQNKATNNHFFSISESVSFLLSLCYTERKMVMKSAKYSYWLSVSDLRRCGSCKNLQGKIFTKASSNPLSASFFPLKPPLHPLCRCKIVQMDAKRAGTATKNGLSGADWWIKTFGHLPSYYITKNEAKELGWVSALGNLRKVAPGKMLIGGVFFNKKQQLPAAAGRIWYEADINYDGGFRGTDRILYSNDGLIFVTYDHYRTFIEII